MGVEGRDLVHFGERELHFLRQRRQMRRRQIPVVVLNQMQVLDKQIAPAWPVDQQILHFGKGRGIDLAALGRARRPPSPGAAALAG